MTPTLISGELKEALRTPGCAICHEHRRAVRRYLLSFLREGKNDARVFADLVQSLGLCQRHAWMIVEIEPAALGDGMSTATLYHDLLDHLLREMGAVLPLSDLRPPSPLRRRSRPVPDPCAPLAQVLVPRTECRVCKDCRSSEETLAWAFARSLSGEEPDGKFRDLFLRSTGLCLPHFRLALLEVEDRSARDMLAEVQLRKMRSLLGELAEYLRKHDARYAHEPYGPEADAWVRAVALFTGEPVETSPAHSRPEFPRASRSRRAPDPGRK
jgi:hypothetical protein